MKEPIVTTTDPSEGYPIWEGLDEVTLLNIGDAYQKLALRENAPIDRLKPLQKRIYLAICKNRIPEAWTYDQLANSIRAIGYMEEDYPLNMHFHPEAVKLAREHFSQLLRALEHRLLIEARK